MSEHRRRRPKNPIVIQEDPDNEESSAFSSAQEQAADIDNPNLMRCPDCLNAVSIHAISCPYCGRPFQTLSTSSIPDDTVESPPSTHGKKPKRSSFKRWIAVLLVVAIAVIAIPEIQKYQLKSLLKSVKWWQLKDDGFSYLEFSDNQIEYSMALGYRTSIPQVYPIHTYNYQVTGRDTIKVGNTDVKVTDYDSYIVFTPSFVSLDESSTWER